MPRKNTIDKSKRETLATSAAAAIASIGLNPACIWTTRFSIYDVLMQPSITDEQAEAILTALQADPISSTYQLSKGLESGIMEGWDTVAATAGQELASEQKKARLAATKN